MIMIETIRDKIAEYNEEAILFDELDDAIIGVGQQWGSQTVVIYDRQKCIDIFADKFKKDGSPDPYAEAVEWFDYNVGCAYVGENTPVFLERLEND